MLLGRPDVVFVDGRKAVKSNFFLSSFRSASKRPVSVVTFSVNNEAFYNREDEQRDFRNLFRYESPKIIVLQGPPSSGKTSMLRNMLLGRPDVVFVDGRKSDFSSVARFHKKFADCGIIERQLFGQLTAALQSIKIETSVDSSGIPSVQATLDQFDPEKAPRLEDPLQAAAESLSRSSSILQQKIGTSVDSSGIPSVQATLDQFDPEKAPRLEDPLQAAAESLSRSSSILQRMRQLPIIGARTPDYGPPVLVIDEANELDELSGTEEGRAELKKFLSLAVNYTKVKNRFHIIMATSDSFFLDWLKMRVNPGSYSVYGIGDLSRQHAEQYFKHILSSNQDYSKIQILSDGIGDLSRQHAEQYFKHILSSNQDYSKIQSALENTFDLVYAMTGGRIMYINQYVSQYVRRGDFSVQDFAPVKLEVANLRAAISNPASLVTNTRRQDPLFTRQDLLKVFQELVSAKDKGFVQDSDFEAALDANPEVAGPKLTSLVEHNILYRRQTNDFCYDLPLQPLAGVCFTAMSVPALCAMEIILQQIQSSR
eukprot:CAMPEP_0184368334 /NCGR_PEP_ID=MMETSP1089-20130417/161582_1 /TAXON_ID=38269 ORGANISM="Gloeochaete wittrockiana, Strain SAG46.84" /NCGR_SAMPLE_ID=MMETSP1089 /ASSEMBLY_ACC=CAM_ASM_000445 /LENGTH=539 /DNA_ID=CAMNT_0026710575 /DNA_START=308 /DNA_END=1929 /DNA_ORIENTATION=+